ncbi:ABC transporter ATP-binding protein [Thermobrachium celere]|uniref:Lipid A export ATP-binding/permease protein MsbA n=1 Tax=Thermobrachium celere DSM 8682 TaxID=941824 RepID=R7RQR1_9CLOT|nr:ABC transporter ATP-binding protein [Thermobrachium celere]CDF57691.1 Lipid A export ATP-binding/permease protein MsbA [Thermobrachium celere DSM 8682]
MEIKEQEFKKNFDLHLWKRLFDFLKRYRNSVVVLVFVMIGVGIIDATFPFLNKYAIDNYVKKGSLNGFWKFILIYIAFIVLQVFNVWWLIALAGKIDMGLCYDIRKSAFNKLQKLSFSFYDKTPVGWIMARLTSDVSRIGDTLAWGIVDFIWGIAIMGSIVVYMFILNVKLAIITLSVVPFLVILSLYFQNKILFEYRKVRRINSQITGAFNEGIMGAKTSKILNIEDKNIYEFKNLTNSMFSSSVRAAVLSSIYMPLVMTLGSIGTALALNFGGKGVILEKISFGTLAAFISYSIQFFDPVRELARVMAEFISAQTAAERVISLIDAEVEIKDTGEKSKIKKIKGDIEFKDVCFSYEDGKNVLENFNLKVKAGQSIALVGETGSGKSTIVNLLCRFYEPTKGTIYIDGVDYRSIPLSLLHSSLGYVLQTPHLFSGTIKENIQYANLDASIEEIIEAAKLANAHDFIMSLEKGYDTEVGEGGAKLSVGQRQLISIARAIVANPSIFILDEATSSVDTETEHLIQQAIAKVLKGRTSFIIAHRLSTIKSADRILVIKDGKIIEDGSHKELMKKRGYYYRLYTNQYLLEQEKNIFG